MILNLELKGKNPFILSFYFRVVWSLVWSGSYCGCYRLTAPHQVTVLSVLELQPSHSKCETEVMVATSLLHHQVLKTNSPNARCFMSSMGAAGSKGMEIKLWDQLLVNGTLISIQTLESQGFFLDFTPFYCTKIHIGNSEITAFFSWELVCCVMVGDLGRRKEGSDSFKISSDTKC